MLKIIDVTLSIKQFNILVYILLLTTLHHYYFA